MLTIEEARGLSDSGLILALAALGYAVKKMHRDDIAPVKVK